MTHVLCSDSECWPICNLVPSLTDYRKLFDLTGKTAVGPPTGLTQLTH